MKVIASHNGLAAVAHAYEQLAGGAAPLEAVLAAVQLVEDDPEELTVGYGGLPNAEGVVQLDAAVMDGRTGRGGAVAALENIRRVSEVARRVMDRTDRVLLVGEGALRFALSQGYQEENLLTDRARRTWEYWQRTLGSGRTDWQPCEGERIEDDVRSYFESHYGRSGGTVHIAAIDDDGNVACVTSTSGHAFKPPGRVGDSPILGAGLYAENGAGTCGSIGHGEANLRQLSSFLGVELMRNHAEPLAAGLEVLTRIAQKSPAEECDGTGRPRFHLQLFLMNAGGEHAGVAIRGEKKIAVADANGARHEPCVTLPLE